MTELNSTSNDRKSTFVLIWTIVALALIALSTIFDAPVARRVHESGLDVAMKGSLKYLAQVMKWPGEYVATICAAALIAWLHPLKWRGGGFVLLATAVSGSNGLVKWIVGRTRPYKLHPDLLEPWVLQPFRGGIAGLFNETNLGFPSGHACLAFANAAALALLLPKWRWLFFALATMTAVERVLENAHYVSDNVAAAALESRAFIWFIGSSRR